MAGIDQSRTTSYLVVQIADQPEWAVLWNTIEVTAGRLDTQDIVIPDPEVSRRHAVFQRNGERFSIEDLETSLGTLVNGAPVSSHELVHGDVVQIGTVRLRFGQTTQPVRPGPNVRFASELKSFDERFEPEDAGGRTMLTFDAEDDLLSSVPGAVTPPPQPRAVTADGALEEFDPPEVLGPDEDLGLDVSVRDLDLELSVDPVGSRGSAQPGGWSATTPTRPPLAPLEGQGCPSADIRVELVVEVQGPAAQVESFVDSVEDKRIDVLPLRLFVRKRDGSV